MPLPKESPTVIPYIIVDNAASFIAFAEVVLGASVHELHMRDEHKIQHAELSVGNSTIMCCDTTDEWQSSTSGVFVYVENADISFQKAVDLGAKVIMPLENKEYGRTCGVQDPFGNTWWLTQQL
jgi:uncharacterized glyoxalase superfamily protein PhnB